MRGIDALGYRFDALVGALDETVAGRLRSNSTGAEGGATEGGATAQAEPDPEGDHYEVMSKTLISLAQMQATGQTLQDRARRNRFSTRSLSARGSGEPENAIPCWPHHAFKSLYKRFKRTEFRQAHI